MKFDFQKWLAPLGKLTAKMGRRKPQAEFVSGRKKISKLVWLAPVPVVLLVVVLVIYRYLPQAEIVLRVEPQLLEKSLSIVVGEADPGQDGALFLRGERLVATVEGNDQIGTTGTKLVGQEAKGEVEVFNATSQEKIFPAGTVITSLSGLEFTFDDEVKVASRSGASDSTPSSLANVTAVEIGAEGNLASGTKFTVGNYSTDDIEAKSRDAFSGGVSREIQVASAEDQASLLEKLTGQLKEKALPELAQQSTSGLEVIQDSLATSVKEKSFSASVGDEVTEISLQLKLQAEVLAYNESELKSLVGSSVQGSVPEGYLYSSEATELEFALQEIDDEVAFFEVQLKAKLMPKLETEGIRQHLAGKRLPVAKTYLDDLANVGSYDILLSPQLPGRLQSIPRVIDHIVVRVELD